jgi:hypothetical protein
LRKKSIKINMYKTVILQPVLYGCGNWHLPSEIGHAKNWNEQKTAFPAGNPQLVYTIPHFPYSKREN